MARKYTPSQCIVTFIVLSTLLTVTACVASALILLLAPEQPALWTYNGGSFAFYPSIALFVAAFGALMISFVGCGGACRDSKLALIMFTLSSFLVMGLYLASSASMFAFAYGDEISNDLNTTLLNKLIAYNGEDEKKFADLQESAACCGVVNYTDWNEYNIRWKRDGDVLAPESCCKEESKHLENCTVHAVDLYSEGCLHVILFRLRPTVDAVLGLSVIVAIVQAVTSVMSCYGSYLIWKYEQYDIL